jgi:hypothetical protein
MPYITQESREGAAHVPVTPGELNYAVTKLVNDYMMRKKPLNYAVINEIMGALAGAKAEFYRRVAVPYEESKKEINGDVYY